MSGDSLLFPNFFGDEFSRLHEPRYEYGLAIATFIEQLPENERRTTRQAFVLQWQTGHMLKAVDDLERILGGSVKPYNGVYTYYISLLPKDPQIATCKTLALRHK